MRCTSGHFRFADCAARSPLSSIHSFCLFTFYEHATPVAQERNPTAPRAPTRRYVPAPATSHQPPATSHQPPATSHQPPATSHQPPPTSHQPPSPRHQPPATHTPPPPRTPPPPPPPPPHPHQPPHPPRWNTPKYSFQNLEWPKWCTPTPRE